MKQLVAVSVLVAVLCAGAACGSGTPSNPTIIAGGIASPTPAPAPSATPTPVPVATPTPVPEPTESPEINDNDRPVEKVGAGVYYVECGGQILENSRSAREVAVGCNVHLDATAKDEDGVPTNPRYPVVWRYSDQDALEIRGSNPMGPIITGLRPHDQEIHVRVDGVDSNKFKIRFY
jgi:hypothetical protein